MTILLNQNENDNSITVIQGHIQDRESHFIHLELLNPTMIISPVVVGF